MRYENQGKRKQQVEFSERFSAYAFMGMFITMGIYAITQIVFMFYQYLQ